MAGPDSAAVSQKASFSSPGHSLSIHAAEHNSTHSFVFYAAGWQWVGDGAATYRTQHFSVIQFFGV